MFLIVALVLMHLVAAATEFALEDAPPMPRGLRLLIVTGLISFVFGTMLSRCLFLVIEAIYTRRDMELLLTSPLAPTSFIGARAMSIAITVTLEFAALLFPFADIFVMLGHMDWLKVYLLVPAFAMLTTSLALLIALGMFQLLGPRRTHVFAQIMSAVVGISFLLVIQLPSMMPRQTPQGLGDLGRQAAETGAALIWQPASLILNGFAATLIFTVGCIALFIATVRALGGPFVSASLLSSGTSKGLGRAQSAETMVFRSDPHKILVSKELRLIARDPGLLSQLLQQLGYAAPIALILWKYQSDGTPWMWLSLILISGSCASALSWLIFTAEDAPDLLGTSPMSRKAILRAKVEAALTPLMVLISVPLFMLLKRHPVFAVSLVVCSAGCAASCALLNVRGGSHRKRAEFNARHQGAPGSGIVEILVIVGWMACCAGIMWLSPWA
ncbi:hypothetical protein [Pseudoduganella namucuonensis]|nr:hypothetical protein [Pseudoduganella namucuonensis]